MTLTTRADDATIDLAQYLIAEHEGFVSHAYQDTGGHWTIGYGRLVDERLGGGIDEEEATYLLARDIERTDIELRTTFRWYDRLDETRRACLIDMTFNLGLPRFMSFRKMIAALEQGDFKQAALEMRDSRWAGQVGNRAVELAKMMDP